MFRVILPLLVLLLTWQYSTWLAMIGIALFVVNPTIFRAFFCDTWFGAKTIFAIMLKLHSEEDFIFQGDETKPTIILLHGSNAHKEEFYPTIQYLKKFNHPIRAIQTSLPGNKYLKGIIKYNFNDGVLPDRTNNIDGVLPDDHEHHFSANNIDSSVYILTEKLKHLKLPNSQKIILVGHSMGGLVASKYSTLYPDQVSHVITFSSPFHGAPLLSNNFVMRLMGSSEKYKQMKPNSEWLKTLHNDLETKCRDIKMLTVGSPIDFHVPEHCAHLKQSVRFTVSDKMHLSIHLDKHVWEKIVQYITEYPNNERRH